MSGHVDVLAVKLSDSQIATLEMCDPEWCVAKPMARDVRVLRSLERRGLTREQAWPNPRWYITDAGRAALARLSGAPQ